MNLRLGRIGTSVPLVVGGCANDLSDVGSFTFDTNNNASLEYWACGSAYNLSIDILYVWRY